MLSEELINGIVNCEPIETNIKIISVRKYKIGYEVRTEKVWYGSNESNAFGMKSAYNSNGNYIGNSKEAYFLYRKKGIKPEIIDSNHDVCSIGFCEKEQKWYGWSHRALYGFGIGSQVKKGDCAFSPSTKEEQLEDIKSWYNDDMYKNLKIEPTEQDIKISYNIVQETTGKILCRTVTEYWNYNGKGEWTAKTLEDAKQMAIDFANDVA